MKIANLKRAEQLTKDLKKIDAAIDSTQAVLSQYDTDVSGYGTSIERGLYSLHISTYGEGSENSIDLSGCMIGIELLTFTLIKLQEQRKKVIDEIESL